MQNSESPKLVLQQRALQSVQDHRFPTDELARQPAVPLCEEETVTPDIQTKSHPTQFKCDVKRCGRVFRRKFSLKRHYKSHFIKKALACKFCGKTFSLPQYLEEHEHIHTGLKPYQCDVC